MGWKDIKQFIDGAGEGLRADRERAMLCVAYETLARRGELVTLEVRDIDFHPNGTGRALIRRGKADAEGQGRVAYLSRETVKWLKIWQEHAAIREGAVFRRLVGQNQIGEALHPGSIAPIFKRVAQWIGMPERFVDRVSGHSTRVGATQDLTAMDIDLAAITQAGGLEVDPDAVAVCGQDPCGEVWDGEGGGGKWSRRIGRLEAVESCTQVVRTSLTCEPSCQRRHSRTGRSTYELFEAGFCQR